MLTIRATALLICVALLTGCNLPTTGPRYQIISAADGGIYRLDTKEGAVHRILQEGMVQLSDQTPVLRVGDFYQMADAKDDTKFLKYLGDGKFEKNKFAIRKFP